MFLFKEFCSLSKARTHHTQYPLRPLKKVVYWRLEVRRPTSGWNPSLRPIPPDGGSTNLFFLLYTPFALENMTMKGDRTTF